MKTNEIANAHGITKSAVDKWSADKKQRAVKLLSAGVDPKIMALVGEVQQLCYAASMKIGQTVVFAYYFDEGSNGHFNVHGFDNDGTRRDVCLHEKMTCQTLGIAIRTLNTIIYG